MKKLFLIFLCLAISLTNPQIVFSKSSFSAAFLVDDQVITFYDINQKRLLLTALTGKKKRVSEVEEILIKEKIQEIYSKRLDIGISNAELDLETNGFLKANNISRSKLKSILASHGVDFTTFLQFIKVNLLWLFALKRKYLGYLIK